nr:alpha/beta hydrolase [Neobacillus sp. Marseille-Q6967]
MFKKTAMIALMAVSLAFPVTTSQAAPQKTTNKSQNQATIPYYVDESKLPFDSLAGYETNRYWGVHNGAGYRIEVPKNWNGELVLYAHGYRGQGLELTVSNPDRLRKYLLDNGYAWAASSYSTNGYDVAQGVKDTHALGNYFKGLVGNPTRTYITGHSMGGHITAVLAEQYAGSYDGAFPMCGVTADTDLFDYFTSYNIVAQALIGIEKEDQQFPANASYASETVPAIQAQMEFGKFADFNPLAKKLKAVTENMTGGDRPLFDVAFESYKNFLLGQNTTNPTYGVAAGNVVNTADMVYQLDSDPALSEEEKVLNESVRRISADPQTKQQGLTGVPKVSGDIKIPVLAMHNIGDLFVPFSMEQIYAERIEANGKSELFAPRAIRAVAHCDFTVEEEVEGFQDLVKWVEEGVKPEGDDILNPQAVAAQDFGSQFTRGYRSYDPLRGKVVQNNN